MTIEESRSAGQRLGTGLSGRSRLAFERALTERISALQEATVPVGYDANEVLAAFDQAAWAAWEAAQHPAPDDLEPADQHRRGVKRGTETEAGPPWRL